MSGSDGEQDERLLLVRVADFHSTGSWPKKCSAKNEEQMHSTKADLKKHNVSITHRRCRLGNTTLNAMNSIEKRFMENIFAMMALVLCRTARIWAPSTPLFRFRVDRKYLSITNSLTVSKLATWDIKSGNCLEAQGDTIVSYLSRDRLF